MNAEQQRTEPKLTLTQKFTETKYLDKGAKIKVEVKYNDNCNNGHNTFHITARYYERRKIVACGSLHDEVAKHFPRLKPFIKWHGTSSDGPLYYIANAVYWLEQNNIDNLKSTIIYGAVPELDNYDDSYFSKIHKEAFKVWLATRLPMLKDAFKSDMESLGFTY